MKMTERHKHLNKYININKSINETLEEFPTRNVAFISLPWHSRSFKGNSFNSIAHILTHPGRITNNRGHYCLSQSRGS